MARLVLQLLAVASATLFASCTTPVDRTPRLTSHPDVVTIPAGDFTMGDLAGNGQADERPAHTVTVGVFALGRHEVSIGEFRKFAIATGYRTDAELNTGHEGCYGRRAPAGSSWDTGRGWIPGLNWQSPGYPVTDQHPVACVSWNDAQATGRDLTPWPDGGTWDQRMNCNDGHFAPAPVGSYAANRFGPTEMIGNLSEWTDDCWHDDYVDAPTDDSAWQNGGDCGRRVVRGGTFVYGPAGLRSANRVGNEPTYRVWYQGFRVVKASRAAPVR